MVPLPQVQQRRSLGDLIQRQKLAAPQDLLGARRQLALQGLRFHRPHNIQPHRGGQQGSEVIEQEQPRGLLARHLESAQTRAENRGPMGERGEHRPALGGMWCPK